MKKFTLFIALVLTAVFGVKTTASAQETQGGYETEEQIEWIKYAVDLTTAMGESNGIYLCHWDGNKTYKFVTAGGTYGTQAIATTRGIKMTIGNSYNGYTFTCTLNNPNYGSCLGAEPSNGTTSNNVYLDRGRGDGDRYFYWNITKLGDFTYKDNNQQKNAPYYSLYNKNSNESKGRYVTVSSNNKLQLTTNGNDGNDCWLFIPRDAFRTVLLAVTHQTNIEVSGLFQNTRFVRYMDEDASWEWWTINTDTQTALKKIDNEDRLSSDNGTGLGLSRYGAYRSMAPGAENVKSSSLDYAKTYGNFSSAEIKEPLIMRQTATKVKVGTYTITAQAFVSKTTNESSTSAAYLFASGATAQNAATQIPELSTNEQSDFNSFYNHHQDLLTGNTKYFRGNVAAGEYLATNKGAILTDVAIYEPNTEFHSISISVTVAPKKEYGTDADGTQYGDLIIGIAKYSDVGTVYARNIRVYYSGTNEFGIDSYSTNNAPFSVAFTEEGGIDIDNEKSNIGGIDEYQYGYARQFNLVRDFGDTSENKVTNPKWEALVLPVNLTVSQVRNAFGNDVQLSELVGLANNGHQIRFNTVNLNLNNPNEIAIKAGGCYVIKVTKAPEVGRSAEYTFDIYNSTFGDYKVPMTYSGPIYQIDGVTRTSTLADLITANGASYANGVVTKTYTTNDGSLNFTGYFYWNQAGVNNAYVVSRGKMFYLETPWKNLTGTMWKLEDPTLNPGEAKDISIDFGDGTITNGISDITADGENTNVTGVYNLNGQKVSDGTTTDNLPKGIYIVNGKKHVVR